LLKIASFYDKNINKVELKEFQIDRLESVLNLYRSGSISYEEVLLMVRGGEGIIDFIAIVIIIIVINTFSPPIVESFQPNLPPHLNPVGWGLHRNNRLFFNSSGTSTPDVTPGRTLEIKLPSSIPESQWGKLTKSEKCQ
jgi:hypothetical protein